MGPAFGWVNGSCAQEDWMVASLGPPLVGRAIGWLPQGTEWPGDRVRSAGLGLSFCAGLLASPWCGVARLVSETFYVEKTWGGDRRAFVSMEFAWWAVDGNQGLLSGRTSRRLLSSLTDLVRGSTIGSSGIFRFSLPSFLLHGMAGTISGAENVARTCSTCSPRPRWRMTSSPSCSRLGWTA